MVAMVRAKGQGVRMLGGASARMSSPRYACRIQQAFALARGGAIVQAG